MEPWEIGHAFARRYESFWAKGAREIDALYAPDAILCGQKIVNSHAEIGALLGAIVGQGWSAISIEIAEATAKGEVILLACRYKARSESDEIGAKSSYALVKIDGVWKASMHTAT